MSVAGLVKRSHETNRRKKRIARYTLDIYLRYAFLGSVFCMTVATRPDQLLFRLRPTDSEAGVSRDTLSRLATTLGIKETQVLHYAVRQLARDVLPAYEADDGALSAVQLRAIRKAAPQGKSKSVKSSLF